MGPTWGHLCHVGPRWAPCWPHEPCYQGGYIQGGVCGCFLTITVAVFTKQGWDHPLIILVWNSLRDLQRDIIERLCSSQEWNGLWFYKNPKLFVWPIFSTYSKLIAFISPPPPPPPPPKKKKKKKKAFPSSHRSASSTWNIANGLCLAISQVLLADKPHIWDLEKRVSILHKTSQIHFIVWRLLYFDLNMFLRVRLTISQLLFQ